MRAIRGNRVRELRENRLMTQAQLAKKAKVALRTIHSVEKGMNCRMDTKRKILLALGLRFEDKDQVFPLRVPLCGPRFAGELSLDRSSNGRRRRGRVHCAVTRSSEIDGRDRAPVRRRFDARGCCRILRPTSVP